MNKSKHNVIATERFVPSITEGLSNIQVNSRLEQGLINDVKKSYSKSYLNILANNLCTFFNLLGLLCMIALIIAKAQLSSFFFVVIYISNIFIGIIQEIRAKRCIDKLSLVANKTVKVIRESKISEISAKEIVLDDIVLLGIGNQVPTDCTIVQGEIEVDEALLTGESVPVKKKVGDILLAGSFIVAGKCTVQATKVGKENYVETLSEKAKAYKKPQSELMGSLKLIIKFISIIIVPVALAYVLKGIIAESSLSATIQGTSAVVIGMIPSGMFLLTSLALAVGIIKLSRHNTLVQDLYSLEMLARVDTICFDKTGTITDGKMTVSEVIDLTNGNGASIKDVVSSMIYALKDNNQTAIALFNYFGEARKFNATSTLPFNSTRKLSAVSFEDCGTYAFGAPEYVLSDKDYFLLKDKIDAYASKGLRVLVLAHSSGTLKNDRLPETFYPVAIILIVDNIRDDAIQTIKWFKDNDVKIKVISGDNPITVAEVSKRVGINNADKYISLEGLSDEEVAAVANEYTVFGRVSPEQKAILIKAMKNTGHVTAMTGDGVNDILALKEADCAISVAAGSDAARNISHIVLMDNNFNSMPKVVHEGRRVINNVQSSASLFLMKTLFHTLMGIIMLFIPAFSEYPFKLTQMILIEVFVIGIPSFGLSLQPNEDRVQGRFINFVISKSLPAGLLMVLSGGFAFIFAAAMGVAPSSDIIVTMSVIALTLAGLVSFCNICKPFNTYRAVLFGLCALVIISVIVYAIINGFSILGLVSMLPFNTYKYHILMNLGILLFDVVSFLPIQKLCSKIKIPEKINFGKKKSV